jgi:hypothetical protein
MTAAKPKTFEHTADRKAEFIHMCRRDITLFIGNKSLDDPLTREELAGLEGVQRHLAISKNLIVASAVISACTRTRAAGRPFSR